MIFGLPTALAGTIIAAVIAAIISLLGLIISKETKISEFRQAWIDSLRAEIAAVITHAQAIHGAELAEFESKAAKWENVREDFVGLNEAWAKVKLRLNPKERNSIAVLRALEVHEGIFTPGDKPDFTKLNNAEKSLLTTTQVVLKEEWRRVKRGEFVYKGATLLAAALVIGGLALLWRSHEDSRGNSNFYHVVERTDTYVDKQGRTISGPDYDHDVVRFVLERSDRKIHAECDLTTLDKLAPNASCGLRPLRDYECEVASGSLINGAIPRSDLTCKDADDRKVYLYVSKEE